MAHFLIGATAMGLYIAGLFFLRFWRDTRDRLFLIFAGAFWMLAVTRTCLGWAFDDSVEVRSQIYWIRFGAFLLILIAIIDKNRPRKVSRANGSGS